MLARILVAPLVAWLATAGADAAAQAGGRDAQLVDLSRLYVTAGDYAIVALPASLRLLYAHTTAIDALTADPAVADRVGPEDVMGLRVRLEPALILNDHTWAVFQAYKLAVELDARAYPLAPDNGEQLAYDRERQGRGGWSGPDVLQAYALAAGEYAALKIGVTRSSWGLGVLANDGAEPRPGVARSPFGYSRFDDRVFRIQLAFFPLGFERLGTGKVRPLTIALAADGVVLDGSADWVRGDRAYQGIAAIHGHTGRFLGGLYAVYRYQDHAGGGSTEVTVFDVAARVEILRGDPAVWAQTELALILGSSDYSQSVLRPGRFDVASLGGVLQVGVRAAWFEGAVEVGTASGDDNAFDDRQRAFSFNREYRVGLLMFREVLKTTTAVGAYNLSDESYRAEPPRGYERVAQGGAVAGATYLNPRVVFRPVPGLSLMAGFLWATSDKEYTDPFASGVAGGASIGPNGARGASELGYELDLGAQYDLELDALTLRMRVEFAFLDPGPVFDSADGKPAADVLGAWVNVEAEF